MKLDSESIPKSPEGFFNFESAEMTANTNITHGRCHFLPLFLQSPKDTDQSDIFDKKLQNKTFLMCAFGSVTEVQEPKCSSLAFGPKKVNK